MTSHAQTQANRQNAKASTGPATPEGKAASSRNATRHGLVSTHFAILPGEDPEAYRASLNDYAAAFRPTDCHECHLIEIMVQSKWRINRIRLIEAALVGRMMEANPTIETAAETIAAALFDGTDGPLKTLQRYHAAAERSYNRSHAQLLAYRMNAPLPGPIPAVANPTPKPEPQPQKPSVPNEPNPEIKAWTANVTKHWPAALSAYKASGKDIIGDLARKGLLPTEATAAVA